MFVCESYECTSFTLTCYRRSDQTWNVGEEKFRFENSADVRLRTYLCGTQNPTKLQFNKRINWSKCLCGTTNEIIPHFKITLIFFGHNIQTSQTIKSQFEWTEASSALENICTHFGGTC